MANPATLKAELDLIDADAAAAPMDPGVYRQRESDAHYNFGQTYVVTTPAGVTVVTADTINGATTAPGIGTPA